MIVLSQRGRYMMINNEFKETQMKRKQKILIVDDTEINRAILTDMLEDEYIIIEAEDGIHAIDILHTDTEIDLILLDIMMPRMDGFEVLTIMNQYHWIEDVPVIMISAENASSYVNQAYGLGVTDYINRPFDETIVRRRVVNTLMLYGKQKKLAQMVTDQIYENEKQSKIMINILSNIVEFRNGESGLHVLHIYTLTNMLLNRLVEKTDKYDLTYSDISLISTASSLHDIGKLTIPDEILNKPGKLTPEEFEVIKTHSVAGASMLKTLPFYKNEPIVKVSYEICHWHHERYDGRGYPDALKGDEIPISAQIVALADVYDALISDRVYKKAIPHEEAIKMILNEECGVFNPLLLECLIDISDHIQDKLQNDPLATTDPIKHHNISSNILQHKEFLASERTLQLLENERTKYQFLALMSREIQFEYIEATHIVTFSDWGTKQLGLTKCAIDPYHSSELQHIIGINNLRVLDRLLRSTTPESPDIHHDFQIQIGDEQRWYHFICHATWLLEDTPQYMGAVGKVIDINEERSQLIKLQHLVQHDSLTQLLTHSCAKEQIQKSFIDEPDSKFALIILDLDNFKQVNDSRGHMFGDKILCYTAECLKNCLSNNGIIARVGGDEFLVFFKYNDNLLEFVEQIFQSIYGEYEGFSISVSMGISTTEKANNQYDILFEQSDQALYAAKSAGRGIFRLYDDSMKDIFSTISVIESELMVNNITE